MSAHCWFSCFHLLVSMCVLFYLQSLFIFRNLYLTLHCTVKLLNTIAAFAHLIFTTDRVFAALIRLKFTIIFITQIISKIPTKMANVGHLQLYILDESQFKEYYSITRSVRGSFFCFTMTDKNLKISLHAKKDTTSKREGVWKPPTPPLHAVLHIQREELENQYYFHVKKMQNMA